MTASQPKSPRRSSELGNASPLSTQKIGSVLSALFEKSSFWKQSSVKVPPQ
jgi:hypothetical protein